MKHATRWLVLMVLASLTITGCGTAAIPTSTPTLPVDTQITLARGMCLGTCPVYTITISADGTVIYEGEHFVQTTGTAEGRLAPEQVRALLQAFDAIDYESYRTSYADNDPTICSEYWTDFPLVSTSLTRNGITKSVNHDFGCRGFVGEQALIDLENQIDAVAGTKQWIGDN